MLHYKLEHIFVFPYGKRCILMARNIRYEPITTKSILNPVKASSMPFEWSINPYRGCQHGCSFCYARATHSFLGLEANDTFQNHILLKENAPEMLAAQLQKWARSKHRIGRRGAIAIGTATDPYQPAEAKALLTRKCLEVLANYPVSVSITTRSPLILRDMDLLKRISAVSVNISVNTLDRKVWRCMEPSSPDPYQRMNTLRRLTEEGIQAGIFLAPILPFLTDDPENIRKIAEAAARNRARFVIPSFLRLAVPEVKWWFCQTLHQHYPQLSEKYAGLYRNSASVPNGYRESAMRTIRAALKQYELNEREPLLPASNKENGQIAPDQQPVQLSFSF